MAFRYLIYSTGTTYADTIVRESTIDDPGVNEASLFSNFVIPEIQPLYLWRVTGGTDVVPNTDANITNYLDVINPPTPDDYVTYGIYTGFTAQTSSDITYISGQTVTFNIFNSFTAQTQTDLAGKIDKVTGATGNVGVFDVSGNLVDTGVPLSATTQDIYVSGMTYIGSTLTLKRTEGLSDLTVTIAASGTSDGVVSGGTLTGTILSLQRTEGLPDVEIELSGLTAGLEGDIAYISGITDQNTADITYISGITDTKLDTAVFNTYTGDTRTELDLTITGATNGLTKTGRDVLLGGALTQNTTITGAGFDFSLVNLDVFSVSFSGISTITDNGTNGGIRYGGDYSAQFVDRSLVDKAYVDAVAAGADWKESVRVTTTTGETDIDLTGGTFTGGTIDGYSLVDGDRVLIKNQDSAQQDNGIYVWSASTFTFYRAPDFDGTPAGEVTAGAVTYTERGVINSGYTFVLVTNDPITVGVTPLVFSYFSSPQTLTAGTGIDITGNVISFDGASVAGTWLQWSGTQLNVTGLTSQVDFNSFTAQTTADLTYISGVTDQNTNDITYLSGVTSGLSASISGITEDIIYISGITSGNTQDIATNAADIAYISGITSGNTADIATNAADIAYISGITDNKLDKVSGATNGNIPIFALSGDSLVDSGYAISGLTASTANEIQLVSTGVTNINTITPTAITWDVVDYSSTTFNFSGGSGIYILETGDYEVSYHLTMTQSGGGQDRSVGTYLILNNTDTLDRTSSAGSTSGADYTEGLAISPTVFSFTAGDRLDLVGFRIGGVGTVNTNPYETVILIKKKGTLV